METNLPTLAGFISTVLFVLGTLPMLAKAFRTKDLASCSLGNILASNVGNIIDWIGLSVNLIFWVGLIAGLTLLVIWAKQRIRVSAAPVALAVEKEEHNHDGI